ncbi:hypothetical protein BX666DRAFT_1177824 [Dichotomocladium elegans]|nr:hypothetical protein BX666DRAFT_1177824 [Dichotomocladium elegans]
MQHEQDEYYDSVELHIRWAEGHDLVLRASPKDCVGSIKQKIRSSYPTGNKNIRLIRNGRILDDASKLADYGIGKIVRDLGSKAKVPPPDPIYLHCSLSDYVSETAGNNVRDAARPLCRLATCPLHS